MKGYFITVEGMDGCGKTTQIKKMIDYITEKGWEIVPTREPGGTEIGEKIRDILIDNENKGMNQITELLLYAASRAELVSKLVEPSVKEGKVVLCDRFVDSSIAYQGYGRNLGVEITEDINKYALLGCKPDITIFFDISPAELLGRKTLTAQQDRIESEDIEFHNRVYNGYLELARRNSDRIKIVDARKSVDEVFNEVKILLDSLLNKF